MAKVVYDDNNQPIEVILPYEEWLRLKAVSNDSGGVSNADLSALSGLVKLATDPTDYQRDMRDGWR